MNKRRECLTEVISVNGLHMIITEHIKLVLDVEQFGTSSNLSVPT